MHDCISIHGQMGWHRVTHVHALLLITENGRATIAGEQTFGKGIIQTIRALSNENGGVAITVARYETPKHNDINKQGVPVDVPTSVECPKTDATACLSSSVFKKPTMDM